MPQVFGSAQSNSLRPFHDAAMEHKKVDCMYPPEVDTNAALEALRGRLFGADACELDPAEAEKDAAYLRSEYTLSRFLVAAQWDVPKAEAMVRKHYSWLAEHNIATLLKTPFAEQAHIQHHYPHTYHGTDKLGRPIYIERPGLIDMPGLQERVSIDDLLVYIYVHSELQARRRLPACSVARGEVVHHTFTIVDLENVGFRMVTNAEVRRVCQAIAAVGQDHYPGLPGKTIVVNAPRAFSILWSFMEPLLSEAQRNAITIYDSDQKSYLPSLLDCIDADQLPSFLGGNCMCDGHSPLSCMMHEKGPWLDRDILEILETRPLEYIMTPEGAKCLINKRASEAVWGNSMEADVSDHPSDFPDLQKVACETPPAENGLPGERSSAQIAFEQTGVEIPPPETRAARRLGASLFGCLGNWVQCACKLFRGGIAGTSHLGNVDHLHTHRTPPSADPQDDFQTITFKPPPTPPDSDGSSSQDGDHGSISDHGFLLASCLVRMKGSSTTNHCVSPLTSDGHSPFLLQSSLTKVRKPERWEAPPHHYSDVKTRNNALLVVGGIHNR